MPSQSDLAFAVQEIYPIESESLRARIILQGDAAVAIDYQVPSASYGLGTLQVIVETEYTIRITPAANSQMAAEDVIAYIRYRVLVALTASRELTTEDAESGALNEATMVANYAAHPYHRQGISGIVAAMGLPPYPLPATFEPIQESLDEKARMPVE